MQFGVSLSGPLGRKLQAEVDALRAEQARIERWRIADERLRAVEAEKARQAHITELEASLNVEVPNLDDLTLASRIRSFVAAKYGVTVEDLDRQDRRRRVAYPRLEAMYEIARRTNLSLPRIGTIFGGRDHTTVLNAIKSHSARNGLPDLKGRRPRPALDMRGRG